jgi:hypothetical protein
MKSPRLSKFLALLIDRLSDRQASPSDTPAKLRGLFCVRFGNDIIRDVESERERHRGFLTLRQAL